ncbi:MAG: GNAT family N-acetyltransferase [Armatimonadota bacterium]|jgi:predicted acetyltransferase
MIARNPKKTELQRAIEVAAVAFPDTPLEEWASFFEMVAEVFGLRYILVVEDEGLIVSTLVCRPAPVYINGSPVSHAAVGAVATVPEARCKGFASEMMRESVRLLRSDKIYLSSLWPFSYPYYRKFGWEVGSETRNYSAAGKVFTELGDAGNARFIRQGDLRYIKGIFDDWAQEYNCLTQRTDVWWDRVTKLKLTPLTEPGSGNGVVVHTTGGRVDGYAVYVFTRKDDRKSISVYEIAYSEAAHRRDMLALLGRLVDDGTLSFYAPVDDLFLQEIPNPRAISTGIAPSHQFRVVDPIGAMASLAVDEDVSGGVSFSISDPVFEKGWDFSVEADGGGIEIGKPNSRHRLQLDIQTFARLYSGYLSPYDAWELGKIRVEGEGMEMLIKAGEIFSPLTPYRTWLEPG